MFTTVTENDFYQAFKDYGRADSWSREGLGILYEWLNEVNPDLELDVIALDCEFCEYESMEEAEADYPGSVREHIIGTLVGGGVVVHSH